CFGRMFEQVHGWAVTCDEIERCQLQTSAEALLDELRSSAPDDMILGARAQILIAQAARLSQQFGQAAGGDPATSRSNSTVELFRKLIELHFRENWSLQRYAAEM